MFNELGIGGNEGETKNVKHH